MRKRNILVVVPIIIKIDDNGEIWIHTQMRRIMNPAYDTFYDGTIETCGETVEQGENIIDAVIRGCIEELGAPNLQLKFIGDKGELFKSTEKDLIHGLKPYYFVSQLIGPQFWYGPVFPVIVPPDFQPNPSLSDGEASDFAWKRPNEITSLIESSPELFMGLHLPAFLRICQDIRLNKLLPKST